MPQDAVAVCAALAAVFVIQRSSTFSTFSGPHLEWTIQALSVLTDEVPRSLAATLPRAAAKKLGYGKPFDLDEEMEVGWLLKRSQRSCRRTVVLAYGPSFVRMTFGIAWATSAFVDIGGGDLIIKS